MCNVGNSNSVLLLFFLYFLCLNCFSDNHQLASREQLSGSLLNFLSLVIECSVLLSLFSRLSMDHLSFIFSLLLIVSVTTSTFGSAIKGNNANGEVKKELPVFT